jgi:hypothetical protein
MLEQASHTYQRLGATRWHTEVRRDLAAAHALAAASTATASMRRRGAVWHITFNTENATVPHTKGLADIARLLAAPGSEIYVLDLMGAADRSSRPGPLADRQALEAYRQRLADIDNDADEANRHHDDERFARLQAERQALLDEIGRITGMHGRPRQFANHPAERARKAVTARIRDSIRKLEPPLPDLAAHLQRTIITGTYCRYRGNPNITWDLDNPSDNRPTVATP